MLETAGGFSTSNILADVSNPKVNPSFRNSEKWRGKFVSSKNLKRHASTTSARSRENMSGGEMNAKTSTVSEGVGARNCACLMSWGAQSATDRSEY